MPTAASAFLTITFNRKGKITGVRQGRKVVRRKRGKRGETGPGGSTKGCKEILRRAILEFLACRKEERKPDPPPCCVRDPNTGDEWCWC